MMITQLPTGNLLAQRGNQTIEFVLCPRQNKWVHPIRHPKAKVQAAKLPSTVERWAEQIFNCSAFKWRFKDDQRPDY